MQGVEFAPKPITNIDAPAEFDKERRGLLAKTADLVWTSTPSCSRGTNPWKKYRKVRWEYWGRQFPSSRLSGASEWP